MTVSTDSVGTLVRRWREHRRRSQLDVSIAADLSTRHLSYIETGRSTPSRAMIERLCEELEVPLRERNALHLAAGFAPPHAERAFEDLGQARDAVRAVLAGHEPNPALAINVRWELLDANHAMRAFLGDLPDHLVGPPLNVLRATLHPDGLAPRILNLAQWHRQVLRRVRRQLERTAAPALAELYEELAGFPVPAGSASTEPDNDLVLPMRLITEHGELSLLYATTVFGSPRDVTLDEIAIETFFPADRATAGLLAELGRHRPDEAPPPPGS
jgi:transcriptional regulator with XRE-family HTH domain